MADLDEIAERTHTVGVDGRVRPLFDPRLPERYADIAADDALVPQWALFDALGIAPMLLMRTETNDLLSREMFEAMSSRRRDAEAYLIEAQGSPALFDVADDVQPIADFVVRVTTWRHAFVSSRRQPAAPHQPA